MKCRVSNEELSAYTDGELSQARASAIEQHLRECKQCREQVQALRAVDGLLHGLPAAAAHPRVQAGVARALAASEPWPDFTCARVQVWMSARMDGELASEHARDLSQHLEICPACASEWQAVEAVSGVLRRLPEVAPPLSLERCIRTEIARRQRGIVSRWVGDGFRLPRLAPGLAPIAAAAMLAAGFWLGRAFPPDAPAPLVATQEVFQGTHTTPKIEAVVRPPQPKAAPTRSLDIARKPAAPAARASAPAPSGGSTRPAPVVVVRRPAAEPRSPAAAPAQPAAVVARAEAPPETASSPPADAAPTSRPDVVAAVPAPEPAATPAAPERRPTPSVHMASLLDRPEATAAPRVHREDWWRKDGRDLLADAGAGLSGRPALRTTALTATVLRADFR